MKKKQTLASGVGMLDQPVPTGLRRQGKIRNVQQNTEARNALGCVVDAAFAAAFSRELGSPCFVSRTPRPDGPKGPTKGNFAYVDCPNQGSSFQLYWTQQGTSSAWAEARREGVFVMRLLEEKSLNTQYGKHVQQRGKKALGTHFANVWVDEDRGTVRGLLVLELSALRELCRRLGPRPGPAVLRNGLWLRLDQIVSETRPSPIGNHVAVLHPHRLQRDHCPQTAPPIIFHSSFVPDDVASNLLDG